MNIVYSFAKKLIDLQNKKKTENVHYDSILLIKLRHNEKLFITLTDVEIRKNQIIKQLKYLNKYKAPVLIVFKEAIIMIIGLGNL